jgi:uncharacterized membrane protein
MKPSYRRVATVFVAGLLAALPLATTALIFVWGARLVYGWLGPGSLVGRALAGIGIGVSGSELWGYAIGVAAVLVGIFALGLLVEAGLQRGLAAAVEAVVLRIPVVRNVYETISRFVKLLSRREAEGLKSMSPVWCHFGGPGGAAVLGLLSSPDPVIVQGRVFRGVLVPTAPVPIGGALVYVPEEWVTPAEIGMEALTSIYVSMGVTAGQYLGPGTQQPGPRRPPVDRGGAPL